MSFIKLSAHLRCDPKLIPNGLFAHWTYQMPHSQRSSHQLRQSSLRIRPQRMARRMRTWRKIAPSLLCPIMKQAKHTCYAISYVRQLEFLLKLHKQMPLHEHLSIQDFINRIPKHLLNEDGALMKDGTSSVLDILSEQGLLLEKDCPLTERLDQTVFYDESNRDRFFAKSATLHKLYPDGSKDDVSQVVYDDFHHRLVKQLRRGCVAVGLSVYPSYSKMKHKHIYYPTKRELAGDTECYGHVMLCTGHDYDRLGRLFYEFQESAGVNVCDRGYVRVYADLVYDFVKMKVKT